MERRDGAPVIGRGAPRRRGRGWLLLLGQGLAAACSRQAGERTSRSRSAASRVDPASRSPVVLLEDKAHNVALPIWIGPAEAHAIASQLEGVESPRPLTHDLMKAVIERVGVGLQRVVIRELRDNTYYASIVLLWDGEEVEIDSRPSDAIALAVRFGQPIFVNRALLEGQTALDLRGRRADALERRRRHRAGTVATSWPTTSICRRARGWSFPTSAATPGRRCGAATSSSRSTATRCATRPTSAPSSSRSAATPISSVQRDGARLHVAFADAERADQSIRRAARPH